MSNLTNKSSKYGPFNKVGKPGTGVVEDVFANPELLKRDQLSKYSRRGKIKKYQG
jgi:hypothetical protein